MSRRRFLSTTAKLAAVGGLAGVTPGLVRHRAYGAPMAALPDPKGNPIEHVVVLMMENRSFDHYFGSLALDECRADVRGLSAGLANTGADGRTVKVFKLDDYCQELDPPHGFDASKIQYANGTNGGYLLAMDREHPGHPLSNNKVMGHYTRADLPFSYAVADEFTICDRYYSSHGGSTFPNRHYMQAAQSFGVTDNRFSPESSPGSPFTGFKGTTIYDRLDEKGVDWGYYFTDLPFLGLYTDVRTKHLDRFRPIEQFYVDALAGNLPAYTLIDPAFSEADDHPSHHIQLGQFFIAAAYNALSKGRAWEKTALFVNYDEDGGFYDHAPHEFFPDDRASADPKRDFGKSGGRIPGMVLSPWAKKGYVYKGKVCHASVLAFVEWRFGLRPMTMRDAGALAENRIFLDAFDFKAAPRAPVNLPVPAFDPFSLSVDCLGGDFAPELPETKLPDPSKPSTASAKAQRLAHEDLFQAADRGLLGFDDRSKAPRRVLDAVKRAQAGNAGTRYVAAASCPTSVLGQTTSHPSAGGGQPATPPAAGQQPGRLAATGGDEEMRLGLGAAILGGAAAAGALRRRSRDGDDDGDVSPR
jgi:phospholipase C